MMKRLTDRHPLRLVGLALASAAVSSLANAEQQRPVGSQYYRCQMEHNFLLLSPAGGMPSFRDITKSKSKAVSWESTTTGPETIEADAVVETDGRISDLNMSWMQFGILGWPYVARTDLDNLLLHIGYGGQYPLDQKHNLPPLGQFDPDKLFAKLETRELKPIRVAREITLSRPSEYNFSLGGLADIPPWQKSASIGLWLRDLNHFRGQHDRLDFRIHELAVVKDQGLQRRYVRGGTLQLGIMPAVIGQFAAAEQKMQAIAADRFDNPSCKLHTVEPDPVNDEEML
jgi:hypothetical protein